MHFTPAQVRAMTVSEFHAVAGAFADFHGGNRHDITDTDRDEYIAALAEEIAAGRAAPRQTLH